VRGHGGDQHDNSKSADQRRRNGTWKIFAAAELHFWFSTSLSFFRGLLGPGLDRRCGLEQICSDGAGTGSICDLEVITEAQAFDRHMHRVTVFTHADVAKVGSISWQ
jgi:hypothetical protein